MLISLKMNVLILLSVIALFCATRTGAIGSYLFTAPKHLQRGTVERFCLTFYTEPYPAFVEVKLSTSKEYDLPPYRHHINVNEPSSCFDFPVPILTGGDHLKGDIELWAKTPQADWIDKDRMGSVQVILKQSSLVTFIQTDKAVYKPGQTVKFRILSVDVDLRPRLGPVESVVIENPQDVRVMQWSDVPDMQGLVNLEMRLSEEPPLGEWVITALVDGRPMKQTFKVEEYVLPKFEVTFNMPSYVTVDADVIEGTVCAQYTYGRDVQGTLSIEYCIVGQYLSGKRPCVRKVATISGCEAFSLNTAELYLQNREYSLWNAKLVLNASVTEEATGVQLFGQGEAEVVRYSLKLDFSESPEFFKPMLPYSGVLKVTWPDGSPAANELVEVVGANYKSDIRTAKNFTSDILGRVNFALPVDLFNKSDSINLMVSAPHHKPLAHENDDDIHTMYNPYGNHYIRAWYSPSSSFLLIKKVKETVPCDTDMTLTIYYTTMPISNITFHYQVISRGNIVHVGQTRETFDHLTSPTPESPNTVDEILVLQTEQSPKDPIGVPEPLPVKEELIVPKHTGKENAAESGPVPVDEEEIVPVHVAPLGNEEMAERVPVDEEEIVPVHVAPLGNEKMAERVPVEEELIVPVKYTPLGGQDRAKRDTDNTKDDLGPDHVPVDEEIIVPVHYEPLGNDGMEDRQPVKEEIIVPVHYEPLGNEGMEDRQPVKEELIVPVHYEPLGNEGMDDKGEKHPELGDVDDEEGIEAAEESFAIFQATHVSSFQITIPVTSNMGPNIRVLVHYVDTILKEVVSDAIEIPVQQCFTNKAAHFNCGNNPIIVYHFSFTEVDWMDTAYMQKVSMRFSEDQTKPGTPVSINITAAANSLCGIGVVDKSVNLLGDKNQVTPGKVFSTIDNSFKTPSSDQKLSCKNHEETIYSAPGIVGVFGAGKRRRRRSIYHDVDTFVSDYVDSEQAFTSAGIVYVTDLELSTRPCVERPQYAIMGRSFDGGQAAGVPMAVALVDDTVDYSEADDEALPIDQDNGPDIRVYFPETWLWQLTSVGDNGTASLKSTSPDTITEWVGSAICINKALGLGVSRLESLRTFKPFFLSYTLPYSAIRGERIPVLVTIFNYLEDSLRMRLTLSVTPEFELVAGKASVNLCVDGRAAKTHRYFIIPKTLGEINITVIARSVGDEGICSNLLPIAQEVVGVEDGLTQPLLVEAEGIPEEYTFSSYVCPKGEMHSESITLQLPPNLVQGSARGYLSVIGDIMGPTLSNLDKLVKLPTGCGEQNMLNFAPNIYVMQYLGSVNQLSSDLTDKAIDYMRTGYQREQNYKRIDGSYSAFGDSDESGSTWLTAFVAKSYAQAVPYISIDEDDLNRTIFWLKKLQQNDGCFTSVGRVLHSGMKGGLSGRGSSNSTLAAFLMIALLEAGTPSNDSSIQGAIRCIEADLPVETSVYTYTLVAYAFTLYDNTGMHRNKMFKKLLSLGIEDTKGGTLHWARGEARSAEREVFSEEWMRPYEQAASAEVEMTAYALMSVVLGEEDDKMVTAAKIVRWLSQQRNAQGGFSSTQNRQFCQLTLAFACTSETTDTPHDIPNEDEWISTTFHQSTLPIDMRVQMNQKDTVVALQALAQFAVRVYAGETSLKVHFDNTWSETTFYVTDKNHLLLQQATVEELPSDVKVTTTGTGCALVQSNVRYNIESSKPARMPMFELNVRVLRSETDINDCKRRTLDICTRYLSLAQDSSNMAIMEVKMPTGWIPIKNTVTKLQMQKFLMIKRFEIHQNRVILYFDEIPKYPHCLKFEVEQNIVISAPKAVVVKVYDYYETDHTTVALYSIKTTCATKEELPITDGNEDKPEGFIGQERMKFPAPPGINDKWQLEECYSFPIDKGVYYFKDPYFMTLPHRMCGMQTNKRAHTWDDAHLGISGADMGDVEDVTVTMPMGSSRCCHTLHPDNLQDLICSAEKVLKTVSSRNGDYPMKAKADLRPASGKVILNQFLKYKLALGCSCDILMSDLKQYILILTSADLANEMLTIGADTIVMPMDPMRERDVREIVKGC